MANTYSSAIASPEANRARGMRFCGSFISPAIVDTSSKPSSM